MANEQRLVQARVMQASTDPAVHTEGGTEFDGAVVLRHASAQQLGAPECDGLLPPGQWRAAAGAAQRFILTHDVHQVCASLVTPEFLPSRWADARSPRAACAREFRAQRRATPNLRNIQITTVTGVEHLSATVNFTEVPECGCGDLAVRLYFEHGRWLVRDTFKT